MRIIGRLARDRRAATVIEYGLICSLIVIAIMSSVHFVAGAAVNMLNRVSNNVDNVSNQ